MGQHYKRKVLPDTSVTHCPWCVITVFSLSNFPGVLLHVQFSREWQFFTGSNHMTRDVPSRCRFRYYPRLVCVRRLPALQISRNITAYDAWSVSEDIKSISCIYSYIISKSFLCWNNQIWTCDITTETSLNIQLGGNTQTAQKQSVEFWTRAFERGNHAAVLIYAWYRYACKTTHPSSSASLFELLNAAVKKYMCSVRLRGGAPELVIFVGKFKPWLLMSKSSEMYEMRIRSSGTE